MSVKPYVIATWPNGTKLIRPTNTSMWEVVGPSARSQMVFGPSLPRRARVSISSGRPDAESIRGPTIWALSLLGIREGQVSVSRPLRLPVVPKEMLVFLLQDELSSISLAPAPFREGLWRSATDEFINGIAYRSKMGAKYLVESGPGRRELAGSLAGSISWSVGNGGIFKQLVMTVPSLQDIANGATPTWAVRNANGRWLPASKISPYDAFFQAGLMVTRQDYQKWLEQNGEPGKMVDDMSAYALLGLPFPPAMSSIEFKNWREAMP